MPNVRDALPGVRNAHSENASSVSIRVPRAIWLVLALVALAVTALRIAEIRAAHRSEVIARLSVHAPSAS